jgi:hypothetical protein
MADKLDKNTNELIKKAMQHMDLESPSKDFNVNLMSKIESLSNSKSMVYKPLISKKTWVILILSTIVVLAYSNLSTTINSTTLINYSEVSLPSLNIPKLKISPITFYSLLLIGIIILIQGTVLKNYFNKRITN